MSEQTQMRLGNENSILSRGRVRRLSPEDLEVASPEDPTEQLTDSERAGELRESAVEAASAGIGAAVVTADGDVYTGCPVEGKGWGVHAIELAVSKAVSEGTGSVSEVAVFSEDGESGLCGRCLQAIADSRDDDVTVQIVDAEDCVERFDFDELYPALWRK
ncbi:Cytidine deaminase [Halogranum rubrum]|uniref:Cytidine deaminase n=1 Tax=Halogranum rubrum TaxID=553466 RepID=A0A1I4JLB9_9EURY|nr:hypothetical protein [Halogranum rubrum]SFL67378.1 Cytidine deaminase [Halogranum rubrum]